MTISEELNTLVASIQAIPEQKKYWLIRTQAGDFYQSFNEYNYVAIGHREIPLSFLYEKRKELGTAWNPLDVIKKEVSSYYKSRPEAGIDKKRIGLIASQICKFVYEVKKGDIVIIPSFNSEEISFGIVTENQIAKFSKEEESKLDDNSIFRKKVSWVKQIERKRLDPYLYRMFTAHQAINDVRAYAEIIERSMTDLFILEDEAHFIINVDRSEGVSAADLFGLGSEILRLVDDFSSMYSLEGVSSKHLQVSININSPGKIDFKSKFKNTTVVAGIILAVVGGGYERADGTKIATSGISNLIKAVDTFREHEYERNMKSNVFNKYKDSLQIQHPDEMIDILKQFSENKDIAK